MFVPLPFLLSLWHTSKFVDFLHLPSRASTRALLCCSLPSVEAASSSNQVIFSHSSPTIAVDFLFFSFLSLAENIPAVSAVYQTAVRKQLEIGQCVSYKYVKDKKWAIKMWHPCGSWPLIGYSAFQGNLTETLMAPSVFGSLQRVMELEEEHTHSH